jgi:hypothetical protein
MVQISKLFLLGVFILLFSIAMYQPFTDYMNSINPWPTDLSFGFVIIGLAGLVLGLIGVFKSKSE